MLQHHRSVRALLVSFLAPLLLVGCDADSTTPEDPVPTVEQVVVISVDGLRGDVLSLMPSLASLRAGAIWSDAVRSVDPALTLPAHLSMLTGRDVTTLGVRSNGFDESTALALLLSGTTTVFSWIDGPSDMVAGASLLPAATVEQARAFLGLRRIVAAPTDAAIVDAALSILAAGDAPALLFVHLAEVDHAGHVHGWIEPGTATDVLDAEYVAAARRADGQIARLHAALAPKIADGSAALLVTADHGGGHGVGCGTAAPPEQEHCTVHPGDQLVPLVLVAPGISPRRLVSSPSITAIAPTAAALLGGRIPPGLMPIH